MKYKLSLLKILIIIFITLFSTKVFAIPWPFSPTDQAHEIIATYGEFQQYLDGEDYTATQTLYAYFHDGIDIYKKDRPEVLSITSGKVVVCYEDGYYYSQIGILTDGSTDEGWIYGHIVEHKVSLNQQVNVKQPIGRVAEYPDGGEWHHLHFMKVRFIDGNGDGDFNDIMPDENGIIWDTYIPIGNPLDYLLPNTDTLPPMMTGILSNILFCKNATDDYSFPEKSIGGKNVDVVYGDVDIVQGVYDTIDAYPSARVAPYKVTYAISGPKNKPTHTLVTFTGEMPSAQLDTLDKNLPVVYKDKSPANSIGVSPLMNKFYFIATNKYGEKDEDFFWDTDDFPDGLYKVIVSISDKYNTAINSEQVLVDNFRPYVKKITITQGGVQRYNAYWELVGNQLVLTYYSRSKASKALKIWKNYI